MTRSQRPGPNLYDPEKFAREFTEELRFGQGVDFVRASDSDLYMALARTVRQALISRWIKTLETQIGRGSKAVVYLSAEYLLGRQLDNALLATNLQATARHALATLDLDIDELRHINGWAIQGTWPQLVVLLDVDPAVQASRMRGRELDRFEREDHAFHERVREGFAAMAAADPQHWVVVDATVGLDDVYAAIRTAVRDRLGL